MFDKQLLKIPGMVAALARDCLFDILASLCTISLAASLAMAIVSVWGGQAVGETWALLAMFALSFIVRTLIECATDRTARNFAVKSARNIHTRFMGSIYALGASGVDSHAEQDAGTALDGPGPRGDRATGASALAIESVSGILSIMGYLQSALPKLTGVVFMPLCICIAIYSQDAISGIIVTVCYPFIIIFMRLIGHGAADVASRRHDGFKRMSGHFADSMRGILTLKAFGAAKGYAEKVYAASERYRALTMRTLRVATLSSTVLDIFATCALAAVAIMLGFRMVEGTMTFLPALIVLILVPEFFKPIKRFAADYHATLEGRASLASILSVIDRAQDDSSAAFERESFEDEAMIDRAIGRWGSSGAEELRLRHVGFAQGPSTLLSDIELSVRCGSWYAIVGPSGAGKTTLANILAGFASPTIGRIFVGNAEMLTLARTDWRRRVAYIPQDPCIFHTTLRKNLKFYDPEASDERIERVVALLGLDDLVASLPYGLDTLIGDGGRQFSGGQLQRIALARVLLDEKRDVWILDEPTAHLDIETELELKDRMLPLMEGKTVFIVTHRLHWIENADNVITMDGGRIAIIEEGAGKRPVVGGAQAGSDATAAGAKLRSESPVERTSHLDALMAHAAASGDGPARTARPGGERRRSITPFFEHKGLLVVSIALGLIVNIFASALMFTSGYMISLAATIPATVLALHVPSIFVRIFGIGKPILDYIDRLLTHDWILRVTSRLRYMFFRYVDLITDGAHRVRISVGGALSFFTQTIENVQDLLIRGFLPLVTCGLTALVTLVLAAIFSIPLAIALLVLLSILVAVIPAVGYATQKKNLRVEDEVKRLLLAESSDNIYGLKDWVLSGRESEFVHRTTSDWVNLTEIEDDIQGAGRLRLLAFNIVFSAAIIVVFAWSAIAFNDASSALSSWASAALGNMGVQDGQPFPPNWIAAFVLCLLPLGEVFFGAGEAAIEVARHEHSAASIASIEDHLAQAGESVSGVSDIRIRSNDAHEEGASAEQDAAIVFDGVRFSYPGSDGIDLSADISIEGGSHVAIIGRSGAGKTTFTKLLAGSMRPQQGRVLVAGRDISELGDGAHRFVSFIEQDPYIFNQSIKENVLLGRPSATDDEIGAALERVGLSDMVAKRDRSLDEVLVEAGRSVSGGERTRLALVRALMADAPVVVLDEPFSGLDPETEDDINDMLARDMGDKTLIVITHHLRGIDRFDRVIMIDGGRIIADGAPADLAREDAAFSRLLAFEGS